MTVGTMTIMTCGMPVLPPPAPGPVPATVQVRSSSSGGIGRQCRGGSALTVRTVGPPGTVAQAAGPWQSQSVTVTVTVPWRPAGGLLRPGPGLLDRAATAGRGTTMRRRGRVTGTAELAAITLATVTAAVTAACQ